MPLAGEDSAGSKYVELRGAGHEQQAAHREKLDPVRRQNPGCFALEAQPILLVRAVPERGQQPKLRFAFHDWRRGPGFRRDHVAEVRFHSIRIRGGCGEEPPSEVRHQDRLYPHWARVCTEIDAIGGDLWRRRRVPGGK